jgi:hypothetical protein
MEERGVILNSLSETVYLISMAFCLFIDIPEQGAAYNDREAKSLDELHDHIIVHCITPLKIKGPGSSPGQGVASASGGVLTRPAHIYNISYHIVIVLSIINKKKPREAHPASPGLLISRTVILYY